jgi:hypothetical protein
MSMAAPSEMDATYRDMTGRRLPPSASLLAATPGHNLFATSLDGDALGSFGRLQQ